MRERNVGSAVVATEDGRPGIITERDFLRAIAEGVDPDAATVEDFMTPSAITSTASWDVFEAAHRMMDGGFRHLIVLDDTGEVEGMVSIRDLFRYLLDQASSRT
jgi:CBS domain-containing protein